MYFSDSVSTDDDEDDDEDDEKGGSESANVTPSSEISLLKVSNKSSASLQNAFCSTKFEFAEIESKIELIVSFFSFSSKLPSSTKLSNISEIPFIFFS